MAVTRPNPIFSTLAILCACVAAGSASAASPDGIWMRGDGNAKVEFGPCGDKLCARNLWIKDTSHGEAAGDKLIMTLHPQSATTLIGMAYDPKRDRSYSVTLTIGDGHMVTRGCIAAGLLCKSVHWTLAK